MARVIIEQDDGTSYELRNYILAYIRRNGQVWVASEVDGTCRQAALLAMAAVYQANQLAGAAERQVMNRNN